MARSLAIMKRLFLLSVVIVVFFQIYSFRDLIIAIEKSKVPLEVSSPLPPVHMNSSWIGNQWIPPPGYNMYSAREIQNYFRSHSILFVGDSTARRTYATMYGILSAAEQHPTVYDLDDRSVIDAGKGKGSEKEYCPKKGLFLCRKMPLQVLNQYDLLDGPCLVNLVDIVKTDSFRLWKEWINTYSLVIFVIGPWEVGGNDYRNCGAERHGRKNQTDIFFRTFFESDELNDSNTTFVWRTWGSPGTTHKNQGNDEILWKKARTHNAYVKALVDSNEISRKKAGKKMGAVSYIDWGQAMLPRLYPTKNRISGDIDPHYGLEARLAFVQMLINHLVERDRQKKLLMQPWINNAKEHGYKDSELFLTISKGEEPLGRHERESLEKAMSSFCGHCIWTGLISCKNRLKYMLNHYKLGQLSGLVSVMKNPACNTSATVEQQVPV